MPFKRTPQTFSSSIETVTIGTGDNALVLGGENVMPLFSFDAPIENKPAIGIEVLDTGYDANLPKIAEFYAGCDTIVDQAKKAATVPGASFLTVTFKSADPNGDINRSTEDCVADAKAIAEVVDLPLAFIGSGNIQKDEELIPALGDALKGKNVLLLSAREENYKTIAASAVMASSQKIGAESAVDINLAKQLNVLIGQMGVKNESIVMNLGTAAVGYGFEYLASTMNRVKAAALDQNDNTIQMPVITPVSDDAWGVKEAMASEADYPDWGPQEERGIQMEISTAAACLACGSNAVVLRHPDSIATISAFIDALM